MRKVVTVVAAIIAVVGLVAAYINGISAILSPVGTALDLYSQTAPEVKPVSSDRDSPFTFPFRITNQSAWFKMHDTKILCIMDKLMFKQLNAEGFALDLGHPAFAIEEKKFANYVCDTRKAITFPDLQSIQIRIDVRYKTLLFDRRYRSPPFEWTTTTGQWIEGPILR